MVQPLISRLLGQPTEDPIPEAPARLGPDPSLESALDAAERFSANPLVQSSALQVARDRAVQQRLDAALRSMTPTLHTPEGDVRVPLPFRMSCPVHDRAARATAAQVDALRRPLGLSAADVNRMRMGRGDPSQMRALAQALIDTGHLSTDPSQPLVDRVRRMMFDYGMGVDCAGFTQLAFLRASGTTREVVGVRSPELEDLSGLSARGFKVVASVSDLRPGDIIALGVPKRDTVGHRAIVYDQHASTDEELARLHALSPEGTGFAPGARVYTVVVDSSWGSDNDPRYGGVERRTWWYDADSGQWAWTAPLDGDPRGIGVGRGALPEGHPSIGFFRGPTNVSVGSP
jgi:hypothetical protein